MDVYYFLSDLRLISAMFLWRSLGPTQRDRLAEIRDSLTARIGVGDEDPAEVELPGRGRTADSVGAPSRVPRLVLLPEAAGRPGRREGAVVGGYGPRRQLQCTREPLRCRSQDQGHCCPRPGSA